MNELSINDFSCLRSVEFKLAPTTVVIGPQGSGKSLIAKLNFFMNEIMQNQHSYSELGLSFDDMSKEIGRQFKQWFPPSAWGEKRFSIRISFGENYIRLMRRSRRGTPSDDVTISFSPIFRERYSEMLNGYEKLRGSEESYSNFIRYSFEDFRRFRLDSDKGMVKLLGEDYISSQVFIPAGRASYTSIGRLVAAVESVGSIDPVVIDFAKKYAEIKDFSFKFLIADKGGVPLEGDVIRRLLGGDIIYERKNEYVKTIDGRRIPFTSLSSGQQEVLPILMMVLVFSRFKDRERLGREVFYIEEPEAHLFPSAQKVLLEFLVDRIISGRNNRSLMITTHSPYILSILNLMLKANKVARFSRKRALEIESIVPKMHWISPESIAAYSLNDGEIENLVDSDGLIDSTYIDMVSEEISRIYDALLDIEFPETVQS